jgi:isopentenyl phosphate kinase
VYVLKIGGSLITNKDGYCEPNYPSIRGYAKVVAKHWDLLKGNLILILGGGSFGNGVPIRYSLKNSTDNWRSEDLLMMTVKMFEWQTIVSMVFREEGVPCYPFQTGAYLTTRDGEPEHFLIEPIKRIQEMGLLPILAGDMAFDSEKQFVIYSSDNMPELFLDQFHVKRVVMLTDVPGIWREREDGSRELIRTVSVENSSEVLGQTGASGKQDVTGGMKNKLHALLRVAEKGVDSIICDGTDPQMLVRALFDAEPPGTIVQGRKKVSMRQED